LKKELCSPYNGVNLVTPVFPIPLSKITYNYLDAIG
jgi:hypothetical protein